MPSLLWTRNSLTWAQLPRKPCKFRGSSSGSWETCCAGKNLLEENSRHAQGPFRRVSVSHAQEKFNGTSSLHCRRDERTADQTPRVVKICTILIPLCTFPLFLLPSISQLIMEWTPKRAGSLYNGQWGSRKAGETLSPSKENLRGRKAQAREEVDRQMESNLGHWGQWKGERKAQKQCGNKIVKSQSLKKILNERKWKEKPSFFPHTSYVWPPISKASSLSPLPHEGDESLGLQSLGLGGRDTAKNLPPSGWLLSRRKCPIPDAEAERRLWKRKTLFF